MTDQMHALSLRWQEVFGKAMPYGFVVYDSDADVLRQCIEQRTMKPLDDLVDQRVGDGDRIY